jgi:hypothetical protein
MALQRDAFIEESLARHRELQVPEVSRQSRQNSGREHWDQDSAGFALQYGGGQAYNEEAFHYFLEIERKRSESSNRPFLLLLIDVQKQSAIEERIDSVSAYRLFCLLTHCVRETDFIGWYREDRVAGAVLTQHGETKAADLADMVRQRIGGELRRVPSYLALKLQVRVYERSPNLEAGSG